jgi:drug/metabolite transporter (DMT)-like permease
LSGGNPLMLFSAHLGIGEAAIFGCVLSWAAYTLIGKRMLGEGLSPLATTAFAALVGGALVVTGVFIINRAPAAAVPAAAATSHAI